MDRPVTQIFADISQAERQGPPTSVSSPKESQTPVTHKLTKGLKQRTGQEVSKNSLREHARDLNQRSRRSEDIAAQFPIIQRGCPWDTLKDLFICDLAGPVSVAVHDKDPYEVIAVRSFSKNKADIWLRVLQKTQHPNVVSAKEIFKDHGMTYFIVDDLPLTLEHVVACDIFPSELQLASILAQVWDHRINRSRC